MRIDAHAHAMHAELGPNRLRIPPLMSPWREPGFTTEQLLERSGGVPVREYPSDVAPITAEEHIAFHRQHGIDKLLLLDPPDIAFEIKRVFGDFAMIAPQIMMDESTPEDIHRILERGAVGIKFIAPMHPYDADCYLPLYKAVRDRNALAVFHTGYLAHHFFDPGGLLPRPNWIDIDHMRPARLDRINRAFPDLKILLAHFGNPWWDEAYTMIASNKNIYADFSGGSAHRRSMNLWKELFAPGGRPDPKVLSRLCYAADGWMFHVGIHETQFAHDFYDRFYEEIGVPNDIRPLIDRENILRLVDPCQR